MPYPSVSCFDFEHFVLELELSAVDKQELLVPVDKLEELQHVVEPALVDKLEALDKPEQAVD